MGTPAQLRSFLRLVRRGVITPTHKARICFDLDRLLRITQSGSGRERAVAVRPVESNMRLLQVHFGMQRTRVLQRRIATRAAEDVSSTHADMPLRVAHHVDLFGAPACRESWFGSRARSTLHPNQHRFYCGVVVVVRCASATESTTYTNPKTDRFRKVTTPFASGHVCQQRRCSWCSGRRQCYTFSTLTLPKRALTPRHHLAVDSDRPRQEMQAAGHHIVAETSKAKLHRLGSSEPRGLLGSGASTLEV